MSASLVRRGLELFSQDVRDGDSAATKKKSSASATGTKDRIGASKMGVKKQKARLQAQRQRKNEATVKGKVIRSAVEEYRKRQATSHFNENLQYMLGSRYTPDSAVTQKILTQNCGRKSKDQPNKKIEKKDEKSVFTEEDFRRFQREYFGGGIGPV